MKIFHTLLCLVALSGCYAVADLERFNQEKASAGDAGAAGASGQAGEAGAAGAAGASGEGQTKPYRDLSFRLQNMKPHMGHRFEYRVVTDENFLVSVGIVAPLGDGSHASHVPGDVLLYVPNAVPRQGKVHLDFFADLNKSGDYDGVGEIKTQDHAWRIDSLNEPDPAHGVVSGDVVEAFYSHDTNFTDIASFNGEPSPRLAGLDATVRLSGMGSEIGHLVEVRLVERANARVVGLYRLTELMASSDECVFRGVVDPGVDYDIEVYADSNADLAFQPTGTPGGDGGWRVPVTAGESGLDVAIELGSAPVDNGVTFTFP